MSKTTTAVPLIVLQDGDVMSFSEDGYKESDGCDTCGYGLSYIHDFNVHFNVHTYRYQFDTESVQSKITHDWMLRVILPNYLNFKKMTMIQFVEWLNEQVDSLQYPYKVFKNSTLILTKDYNDF